MNVVKTGLLGLGTVGSGTVNILTRNAREITRRLGCRIQISHAAAKEYNPDLMPDIEQIGVISDDAFAVVADPEVVIVIELIGGISLPRELVLQAIDNGKHVVTANKALIASHGNEIFAAARKKGVIVAFEAAVAGGIPIIKAIREGLAANRIEWVAGIINGTGNYILTEMGDHAGDFQTVLKEAQKLGYAEADPTLDIEGIDAAHKLAILSSIAFGMPLCLDDIYVEGITGITQQDIAFADELGYRVKHIGITRKTIAGIELRVHPALIPKQRLIANVNGIMNAVLVKGDAVGPTLYYGAGAGSEPTASAVVADVVDIVRALTNSPENCVPHFAFQPDALSDFAILPIEQVETAYYLRMQVIDRPGVLAEVTQILGGAGISIEAILQKEFETSADPVPVIFLTQRVLESNMKRAIEEIEQLEAIQGRVMRIRMEMLE